LIIIFNRRDSGLKKNRYCLSIKSKQQGHSIGASKDHARKQAIGKKSYMNGKEQAPGIIRRQCQGNIGENGKKVKDYCDAQ
jgi:hypothetical protein